MNQGSLTASEMTRLADRARQLSLVEPDVETSEAPWRRITADERVSDLKRFIDHGRLLEIGSSTGDFLASAGQTFGQTFKAEGVEADVNNLAVCLSRSLDCRGGTLSDVHYPADHFDVAVLYHVIEHFRSPSSELRELHRVIKPGGLLVIETPDISSFWFSLLGSRWRQIIPDHVFFFTPATLKILLDQTGFEILESRSVGKAMSVRLFISRLGRYHQSSARLIARLSEKLGISDLTLRLKLGDVIRVYARKKD
ncbi:MAG: class I SAM-dependent methyltransferase [Acidobacteria bacterium]|nr:class I SAM-dependent methyltransferase [Acidobacteriota bacterium]